MTIDQTASERELQRTLYVLKLLRAMVLHVTLAILAAVLYFAAGIKNAYPVATAFIEAMRAQAFEYQAGTAEAIGFGLAIVLGSAATLWSMLWIYRSLTSVNRRALRVQATLMLGLGALTLRGSMNGLLFALRVLDPLFAVLATVSVVMVAIVVPASVALALIRVSRLDERSSFLATLDPRLAPTRLAYLLKLLDLPRTPLRTLHTLGAFTLALAGALLMIAALMYLVTVGGASNKLAAASLLAPYDVEGELLRASYHEAMRICWMLPLALVGVKVAALCQSLAKRIGGLSLTDVVTSSQDRFLLYLRPFDLDDVILPKPRLTTGNRLFSFRPYPVRIEEELFDVADGYLPLIAIGKPGTASGARGGLAYRTFLADDQWQAFAADRIRCAERIVMVVEETPGVRWEIDRILADGAARKTLFFFRPPAGGASPGRGARLMIVETLKQAGLVSPDFQFDGSPLGFYLDAAGEVVEIVNQHWSATSYRTAFSQFLADRGSDPESSLFSALAPPVIDSGRKCRSSR